MKFRTVGLRSAVVAASWDRAHGKCKLSSHVDLYYPNGLDHVDGYRSIFLAISPWVKHEHVSHVHTSLASIFKTVDLILGIPPLNQYDAAATDLREMFTGTPDFTPYTFAPITFAQASPMWRALTQGIDFSRPDDGEALLQRAILESEGLPREEAR